MLVYLYFGNTNTACAYGLVLFTWLQATTPTPIAKIVESEAAAAVRIGGWEISIEIGQTIFLFFARGKIKITARLHKRKNKNPGTQKSSKWTNKDRSPPPPLFFFLITTAIASASQPVSAKGNNLMTHVSSLFLFSLGGGSLLRRSYS
ncbi:hypothetical protein BX661DRAFT_16339 [Kickxella alabastrina]|uniref:uncharacterized protein n=1 Tax=Kickxella alabastrina TaxID=61397 RepID=UPI002220D33C|nr:uncharacterized protein BX661DRAFT_16339 [Kickxella alabastrina]KAI7827712.1 hypothetical protein BX661DRAFT_16339 [Kickxella alabastrina]